MNEEKNNTEEVNNTDSESMKIEISPEWAGKFTLATAVQYCMLTIALLIAIPACHKLTGAFPGSGAQLPMPFVLILKGYIAIVAGFFACVLFVARAKGGAIISFVLSILAQFSFVLFCGAMMLGIFLPLARILMQNY